uniref:glucosaminidase domain-containing protein n=1 Tax=Flavobacterium sp. TaxID=239 RepID=UPI004048F2F3
MYRIVFIFCSLLILSCGSSKKVITTKKTTHTKSNTTKPKPVVKTTPKKQSTTPAKPSTQPVQESLEATSNISTTTDVVLGYIQEYQEVAKYNMKTYGVPASITLAQGILESGAGNGKLSKIANNHFGIKCHKEWDGPSVRHDDDAAQECFRKYEHPSESYRDHSLFLTSRSRYNSLFDLPKNDYKAWAKGLRKAGYATDPKYPDKLISLIERYELFKIDSEVLEIGSVVTEPAMNEPVMNEPVKNEIVKSEPTPKTPKTGVIHKVEAGDTLYSLSRKYEVSVSEIKKINNLSSDSLSLGQILKIR